MARGRLRCIGNSIRLKARFGSGYRVSIRVAGASGIDSSDSGEGISSEAVPAVGSEQGEIQPEPLTVEDLQPPQQQLAGQHQEPQPQQQPQQQEQQRDPAAARQAAAVRALFLRQLGIKPSDESLDYLHFLVPYEHEDRLPALFSHLKASRTHSVAVTRHTHAPTELLARFIVDGSAALCRRC